MIRTASLISAALFLSATSALAQQPTYTPQSVADYEACKTSDRNNQILGTVAGGLIGGLIGDKIDDGAGTIIGGAAGAYAGNRIANKDCSKLLVPAYAQNAPVYTQGQPVDQAFITYDARSGQYIDNRTGAVIPNPNGSTAYTQQTPNTQPTRIVQQPSTPSGMVRVTDPQTGNTFLVSQSDYDRYYR